MDKSIGIILLLQIFMVSTLQLPPYLKKCQKNNPEFNSCLMDNFKNGLKELSENGDNDLKIKNIEVVEVEFMEFQATPSVNVTFHNLKLTGFKLSDPKDIKLTDDKLTLQFFTNEIILRAIAKVSGKLLMFNIGGDGPVEVTLQKPLITYKADLKMFDKSGQKFIRIIRDESDTIPGGMVFNLGSVFSFNDQFGDNMNRLLNLYWKEIYEEARQGVSTTISTAIRKVVQKYFNQIPIDELIEM